MTDSPVATATDPGRRVDVYLGDFDEFAGTAADFAVAHATLNTAAHDALVAAIVGK